MVGFGVTMAIAFAMLAALCLHALMGFRACDRPGDARVSALLRDCGRPGERRAVVIATVRNPSAQPVIAGLSVRRTVTPRWLCGGPNVTVPFRTARRRLRPTRYETVGVVPARDSTRFPVPARRRARHYVLIAAIGQADGRLLLHRLHVGAARAAWPGTAVPFDDDLLD